MLEGVSGIAKQGVEAILLEMAVVGKDVGDVVMTHGLHGDAVGQTVAFVRALAVQLEPGQERFAALRNNAHIGILQKLVAKPSGPHGFVTRRLRRRTSGTRPVLHQW